MNKSALTYLISLLIRLDELLIQRQRICTLLREISEGQPQLVLQLVHRLPPIIQHDIQEENVRNLKNISSSELSNEYLPPPVPDSPSFQCIPARPSEASWHLVGFERWLLRVLWKGLGLKAKGIEKST